MSDPASMFVPPRDEDILTTYSREDWQEGIFYMTGRAISAFRTFEQGPLPDTFQKYIEEELVSL